MCLHALRFLLIIPVFDPTIKRFSGFKTVARKSARQRGFRGTFRDCLLARWQAAAPARMGTSRSVPPARCRCNARAAVAHAAATPRYPPMSPHC